MLIILQLEIFDLLIEGRDRENTARMVPSVNHNN